MNLVQTRQFSHKKRLKAIVSKAVGLMVLQKSYDPALGKVKNHESIIAGVGKCLKQHECDVI